MVEATDRKDRHKCRIWKCRSIAGAEAVPAVRGVSVQPPIQILQEVKGREA